MRYAKRTGRRSITMASALGLALTLPGCGSDDTVMIDSKPVAIPTNAVLAQDANYMGRLFNEKSNGRPFSNLDLADQRQYAFLIHRMLRAGQTPSNSPRLFQRISES